MLIISLPSSYDGDVLCVIGAYVHAYVGVAYACVGHVVYDCVGDASCDDGGAYVGGPCEIGTSCGTSCACAYAYHACACLGDGQT